MIDRNRSELRELVAGIAADPAQWRSLVRHDTGFHDHDVSSGAVAVVEGELIEERLVLAGAPLRLRHRAGEVFDFGSAHVHRMLQDSDTPAVSIHAYSPPLWRMGSYAVNPDGTLCRQSISYAEELRPAESAG